MVPDRDGYPLSCRLLYHTYSASVFLHGCNTGWLNQEFNEHGRQQIAQRLIRTELGDGVSPSLSVDSASVAALGPLGPFWLAFRHIRPKRAATHSVSLLDDQRRGPLGNRAWESRANFRLILLFSSL